MEKRHLDRRLAQMEAEGTRFRAGVDVGVDITGADLRKRYDAVVLADRRDRGARPARPGPRAGRRPPGDGVPPAGQPGAGGRPRASRRSTPPASTSSSSAAATPAPTASARRTARAPRRSRSWRSCRGRRTSGPARQPWPTYPMIFRTSSAHEEGGERVFAVAPSEFVGDGAGPAARARAGRGRARRRPVRRGRRAPSARSRPTSCCSRWASPGPETGGLLDAARASQLDAARQRRPRRRLRDQRRRGVRRRRRRPRAVADRVGDRRGPVVRRGGRRVARPAPPALPAPIPPTARPLTSSDHGRSRSVLRLDRVRAMRRAKIVCTLGPGHLVARADPRARRRGHGRRPAEPQPRRLRRPRGGLPQRAPGRRRDRPRRRHPRRPAGPEDPARPLRRRSGAARAPATRSRSPPTTSPATRELVSTTYEGLPGDVTRRRPRSSSTTARSRSRSSRSTGRACVTAVVEGGMVSDHKGINLPGVAVERPGAVREGRRRPALGRCASAST